MDYKNTLNLPKTGFPMKANLPEHEPRILKAWEEMRLYELIRKKLRGKKKFILHDGPPYANGDIHMGHVLNKMLKDIIIKYKTMRGCDSPYVPGWDCHGLPVEHQLFKELKITKYDIGQVEFRTKAFGYAMKYVGTQKEEFKRLGVFADWDKAYLTLSKDYEARAVRSFAKLVELGYIYKGLKPVNWCATCETALAEAEVEYENKSSLSVYVKFPSSSGEPSIIIWTTTPWTLLANVAIAVHPDYEYAVIRFQDAKYIMAKELVDSTMSKFGIKDFSILKIIKGKELEGKAFRHPFIDRASRVVLADYVSLEEGTGCVHTAPGHGQEDYLTGKKYNLPMIMPVDPNGRFDSTCGDLSGLHVYKADKAIIEKLRADSSLLHHEDITHSYPHCWRCRKPIIFRATEQYFMNVDHRGLRNALLESIRSNIRWIPSHGRDRISAMVESRPDWCLSRQRYWGIPIVAFKCKGPGCKEIILDAGVIEETAKLIERDGSDIWFLKDARELLPKGTRCRKCSSEVFEKEENILDVWFESGVSHQAVLKPNKDLDYPCELYLEGSDQHRGWFQSSLITALAIDAKPPYRNVLTHGFVVDGEGRKMSKSQGNVISPQGVMKKFGADILRLWAASSDYAEDIRLSDEILTRLSDAYRKIRNTYKYLLSNLYDFDPEKDYVAYDSLLEADRWMLAKLGLLIKDAGGHYDEYLLHRVFRQVYNFCTYEISSIYLDILKDRMYTFRANSLERRSAQTVLFEVLVNLLKVTAPILSFTNDEAWDFVSLKNRAQSIHLEDWPDEKTYSRWSDEPLLERWKKIIDLRETVLKELEAKRQEGKIGSPLEARITISSGDRALIELLNKYKEQLPYIFIVSQVKVEASGEQVNRLSVAVEHAEGKKCERCWNWSDSVGTLPAHPTICSRCVKNI